MVNLAIVTLASLTISTFISMGITGFKKFNTKIEKYTFSIKYIFLSFFITMPLILILFLIVNKKENEMNEIITTVDMNVILWASTIMLLSTLFIGIIFILINYIFKLKKEIKELKEIPQKTFNNNHRRNYEHRWKN